MQTTRLIALLAAVIAVLLLGHALYVRIQFDEIAAVSLTLGLVFAAGAIVIRRRAPRA